MYKRQLCILFAIFLRLDDVAQELWPKGQIRAWPLLLLLLRIGNVAADLDPRPAAAVIRHFINNPVLLPQIKRFVWCGVVESSVNHCFISA